MKLFKSLTALIIISASVFNVTAEKVTFPVKGLVTASKEAVPVTLDWNEQWFGQQPSTVYNHDLCRIAGVFASVAYMDGTQKKNEITSCFRALGVKDSQMQINYNVDYKNGLWGNDQTAFSFAVKEINSSKGKRNLIFIIIRGTPLNANEWVSNINISDRTKQAEEFHEGFLRATKQIEAALISFLLKRKIDIEDCFLLITGHSRGAAVANLLSAQLIETELFKTENIYSYTFAAPNVTTNDDVNDPKYGYIWNIINAEDIVPTVPMNTNEWKYRKYGNIKAIVNSWNSDPEKYKNEFVPAMNSYFSKFMLRDFCPFGTGIFLPVEISALAVNLNPNVEAFYSGIKEMRTRAEAAFWKIFPPESEPKMISEPAEGESTSALGSGVIASMATNFAYKQFGVDADYLVNCFVDMHAMETYLSWVVALKEEDVYSTLGTNIVVLEGTADCAVFDQQNNCVASIMDGVVSFEKIRAPVAASSLLQNYVAIGLPANQTFTLAVGKESVAPTRIKAKINHYSADGTFTGSTEQLKLYPTLRKIYVTTVNEDTLTQQTPGFTKLTGKESKNVKKQGELIKVNKMRYYFEISGESSGSINGGFHVGTSRVYASAIAGYSAVSHGRSLQTGTGLGNEVTLTGKTLMNVETYGKFFYTFSEDFNLEESRWSFVPSARITLSYKPVHKTQLFAGINLDMHIAGFNDPAFDDAYRLKIAGQVWTGSALRIVPNFTFGINF